MTCSYIADLELRRSGESTAAIAIALWQLRATVRDGMPRAAQCATLLLLLLRCATILLHVLHIISMLPAVPIAAQHAAPPPPSDRPASDTKFKFTVLYT